MTNPPRRERSGPEPARLTPYELVFVDAAVAGFPRIARDAELNALDPAHPESFAFIPAVGEALRELLPPDAPPDALEQYRALFFHAFNFWGAGRPLYLLEPAVARFLVEAAPALAGWEVALPADACYLQLPANLFWGSIAPDVPPEPVDGFFVTRAVGEDALGIPYQRLDALMVLGLRRERAGFSVIPFHAAVASGVAAQWVGEPAREQGADFASVLPGGELAGLYSIVTVGEALKLLVRALWYIDRHPEGVLEEPPAGPHPAERPEPAPLSHLSFQRVRLASEGGAEAGA